MLVITIDRFVPSVVRIRASLGMWVLIFVLVVYSCIYLAKRYFSDTVRLWKSPHELSIGKRGLRLVMVLSKEINVGLVSFDSFGKILPWVIGFINTRLSNILAIGLEGNNGWNLRSLYSIP